jgi:hypothetical protein
LSDVPELVAGLLTLPNMAKLSTAKNGLDGGSGV